MAGIELQQIGPYQVTGLLRVSPTSNFYQGKQRNKDILIQRLNIPLATSEGREHFLSRARQLKKLKHRNIVNILDANFDGDYGYLVMEYTTGETLSHLLTTGKPITPNEVKRYLSPIAGALHYAYMNSTVHANLHPGNLLVGKHNDILLTNFALTPPNFLPLLDDRALVIPYMAPEHLRGHPIAASDQYSLAVIVYELLCGRRPYRATDPELLLVQQEETPMPLPSSLNAAVWPAIEQVIMRALARDPDERFPHIQAFADHYLSALIGFPVKTTETRTPRIAKPKVSTPKPQNMPQQSSYRLPTLVNGRPVANQPPNTDTDTDQLAIPISKSQTVGVLLHSNSIDQDKISQADHDPIVNTSSRRESMPASLNTIVQMYFNDETFVNEGEQITQSRDASLPNLRRTVQSFIDDKTSLSSFREQIDKTLPKKGIWGAGGTAFLMELNKLVKNHLVNSDGSKNTVVEDTLRQLLTDLSAENIGQRIEEFHAFLQQERTRFQQEHKPQGTNVFPGNSALIISLFTHWLDWKWAMVIYSSSLLSGLKILIDAGVLSAPKGLRNKQTKLVVNTETDHQMVMQILDSLNKAAPLLQTTTGPYWAERFLLWITEHPEALEETGNASEDPIIRTIQHYHLIPTLEPHLTKQINELRRHILIDEKLVRRIYHALLAGHVILTGPPGTGKTVLAQLIPELLWQQDHTSENQEPTAYTAQLVTATDEWSVRTLIGGLAPISIDGQVAYHVQYGHLTEAIRKNWTSDPNNPQAWREERISVYAPSALWNASVQEFRGLWLIIDEFNRAPIDLALGEALTSLSNGSSGTLRVPTNDGSRQLPIPKDFRIIGTLNSFDRNYLNQISEALKRRFSFIEILPPTRAQREQEQKIVLYKAFEGIEHLNIAIINWQHHFMFDPEDKVGIYRTDGTWGDHVLQGIVEAAWNIFEIIRVYRQLGTAQAIALVRTMLIAGFMQKYSSADQWREALDTALCDTIADQLQVLLPDELEVLYWSIKRYNSDTFIDSYNQLLSTLAPRRRKAQLEALGTVLDQDGNVLLDDEQIEKLVHEAEPQVSRDTLILIFHLDQTSLLLPQFARRLRIFKAERGL
jgi:serine/threonine protein kinase/MoxR-like ATPase